MTSLSFVDFHFSFARDIAAMKNDMPIQIVDQIKFRIDKQSHYIDAVIYHTCSRFTGKVTKNKIKIKTSYKPYNNIYILISY